MRTVLYLFAIISLIACISAKYEFDLRHAWGVTYWGKPYERVIEIVETEPFIQELLDSKGYKTAPTVDTIQAWYSNNYMPSYLAIIDIRTENNREGKLQVSFYSGGSDGYSATLFIDGKSHNFFKGVVPTPKEPTRRRFHKATPSRKEQEKNFCIPEQEPSTNSQKNAVKQSKYHGGTYCYPF